MTINSTGWAEATQAVNDAERILIVTHVSPDGDAIGSLLGLTNALRLQGKQIDAAVDGGVPDFLRFLPGADTVLPGLSDEALRWDLLISVDASDEERTGDVGAFGRARSPRVINLDHHTTNTMFGDIHLVKSDAVSATEVIFLWLREMGDPISIDVAGPLLTGLVTDTIGFRTSNVTAGTLAVAQELMKVGVSLTEITERTLDNRSILVANLWKYALASIEMREAGVVSANVTQEDLKRAGLRDVTDGGLVQFLIRINEATISVVFKELQDGKVEISLRSKPGYDVGAVAFGLGGGGHKQASGATIEGPLEAARSHVFPLLIAAAKQGKLTIA
jgi:phosphoesterase RecJ-like protein